MSQTIRNQPYDEVYEMNSETDDHDQDLDREIIQQGLQASDSYYVAGITPSSHLISDYESEDEINKPMQEEINRDPIPNDDGSVYRYSNEGDLLSAMHELFNIAAKYKPQDVELDPQLKCFIPEYIPAVGDNDAFIKIPRPDNRPDFLGLSMLDEPNGEQSDPTILMMKLRALTKASVHQRETIKTLDFSKISSKNIDHWINNVDELHGSKPPPTVVYKKQLPDVEYLLQEWNPQVESFLQQIQTLDISCLESLNLDEICKIALNLIDIPYYDGALIESLHLLFTLYLKFSQSQHFNELDNNFVDRGDFESDAFQSGESFAVGEDYLEI